MQQGQRPDGTKVQVAPKSKVASVADDDASDSDEDIPLNMLTGLKHQGSGPMKPKDGGGLKRHPQGAGAGGKPLLGAFKGDRAGLHHQPRGAGSSQAAAAAGVPGMRQGEFGSDDDDD